MRLITDKYNFNLGILGFYILKLLKLLAEILARKIIFIRFKSITSRSA